MEVPQGTGACPVHDSTGLHSCWCLPLQASGSQREHSEWLLGALWTQLTAKMLSAKPSVVPCMQAKPKFAQLLIPTVDSVRYEYLLALVLSVQKVHTLLFTCQ